MNLRDVKFPIKEETSSVPLKEVCKDTEYFYIGNIPSAYRSANLRAYFGPLVELCAFSCFHFRHRPEQMKVQSSQGSVANDKSNQESEATCCCIVQVIGQFSQKLLSYNGKFWPDKSKSGKQKHRKVCIRRVNVSEERPVEKRFRTKAENKAGLHQGDQVLYKEDIGGIIELNPPGEMMPQGNVGTPTKHFHQLIKECKLPCSVIKSLGIVFPKKQRSYCRVEMDYDQIRSNKHSDISEDKKSEKDSTSHSKEKSKKEKSKSDKTKAGKSSIDEKADQPADQPEACEGSGESDEDAGAEDWERHEALHDDVDNQNRPKNKDKLYEEDIELKWEKGGSGLVFYTDAYFWNELKGKDFDEDTTDDWDVDYSIYYQDGAGDKAARDQLQMRLEQRRRSGKQVGPVKYSDIRRKEKQSKAKMDKFGEFEKHSKGFGSRILKKQGWKEGDGVGSSKQGISEPIEPYGQRSRERVGLGYYGEKLDRTQNLKRPAERDVYISTVYDAPDREGEDALRYYGNELLKYRPPPVAFKKPEQNSAIEKPSAEKSSANIPLAEQNSAKEPSTKKTSSNKCRQ